MSTSRPRSAGARSCTAPASSRYRDDFYDEFLVAPGRDDRRADRARLPSARVFTLVMPPGTGADADFVLDGFVTGLYVDGRNGSAAGRGAHRQLLPDHGGRQHVPLWSKEYHRRVQLASMTAATIRRRSTARSAKCSPSSRATCPRSTSRSPERQESHRVSRAVERLHGSARKQRQCSTALGRPRGHSRKTMRHAQGARRAAHALS